MICKGWTIKHIGETGRFSQNARGVAGHLPQQLFLPAGRHVDLRRFHGCLGLEFVNRRNFLLAFSMHKKKKHIKKRSTCYLWTLSLAPHCLPPFKKIVVVFVHQVPTNDVLDAFQRHKNPEFWWQAQKGWIYSKSTNSQEIMNNELSKNIETKPYDMIVRARSILNCIRT